MVPRGPSPGRMPMIVPMTAPRNPKKQVQGRQRDRKAVQQTTRKDPWPVSPIPAYPRTSSRMPERQGHLEPDHEGHVGNGGQRRPPCPWRGPTCGSRRCGWRPAGTCRCRPGSRAAAARGHRRPSSPISGSVLPYAAPVGRLRLQRCVRSGGCALRVSGSRGSDSPARSRAERPRRSWGRGPARGGGSCPRGMPIAMTS